MACGYGKFGHSPLALLAVPAALWILCWLPGRFPGLLILLLAQAGFTLLLRAAGEAANHLAASASPLARTSPGSGLWLWSLLMLLIANDAIRRLTARAAWRCCLTFNCGCCHVGCLRAGRWMGYRYSKEYANRRYLQ